MLRSSCSIAGYSTSHDLDPDDEAAAHRPSLPVIHEILPVICEILADRPPAPARRPADHESPRKCHKPASGRLPSRPARRVLSSTRRRLQ
jgi:hypothetical protein